MATCDPRIVQLREKRAKWLGWLCGEDVNTIEQQLIRMTWNVTVYRIAIEAHRLAPSAEEGGKQLNGPLFRMLHLCFVESFLLGIRRLMEDEGTDGKWGVYSLKALLKDMSENVHLLTRSAIIGVGPDESSGTHWKSNSEYSADWTYARNQMIDKWVALTEAERSPLDQISASLFDDPRTLLEQKFRTVKLVVDKAIAHAATEMSRGEVHFENIPLDDLYGLHAEMCKTAHFLRNLISDSMMSSFLPNPLYDQFQYLSRPIVAEADIPKLAKCWRELAKEYERHSDG